MLTETIKPCDGMSLARMVRAVGLSARRSLHKDPDLTEARDLLRAIDLLELELELRPSSDLSRWVTSLRNRIELHSGIAG